MSLYPRLSTHLIRWWLLACGMLLWGCGLATAQPLRLDQLPVGLLGARALYLQEPAGAPMDLAQVRTALREGQFRRDDRTIATYGLGARPVWIYLALENPLDVPLAFRFAVGTSWIDRLDIWQLRGDELLASWRSGDEAGAIDGAAAVVPGLGFAFPLWVPPGPTEVFIRAESADPLVLPLSLLPTQEVAAAERRLHYGYGLLYGFLLALIAYNAMVYSGLRTGSYLRYASYLLSFIALNLSYTGHGFAWWWPDDLQLQRYVILALMLLFGVSGFLFASHFLDLRHKAPRLRLGLHALSATALLAMAACVLLDQHLAADRVAFSFLLMFVVGMVGLGLWAVARREPAGHFFLAGALCGMGGTGLTAVAVLGWLPLTVWTFHGAEFGVLLEAVLLALALAGHMRVQELARHQAEHQARTDALTGLANRRAFFERARGLWATALRRTRPLSVVMLDIDHFKDINDRYGHDSGDLALVQVADLLRQTCRIGDVSARWGGEEFLLLLPETDLAQAWSLAERLRLEVEACVVRLGGDPLALSISLGVAQMQGSHESLERLIAEADQWLYRAKSSGRNRVMGPELAPASDQA